MSNEPTEENDLPSYEQLTEEAKKHVAYGRVHPAGLPPEKPPGPMHVRGRNPAYKWFANLPETDPALSKQLLAQIAGLPVADYRQIIYMAYSHYCYGNDQL